MIATLQGEITQVDENAIIVETMGFGIRVNVPAPFRMRLKPGEIHPVVYAPGCPRGRLELVWI